MYVCIYIICMYVYTQTQGQSVPYSCVPLKGDFGSTSELTWSKPGVGGNTQPWKLASQAKVCLWIHCS